MSIICMKDNQNDHREELGEVAKDKFVVNMCYILV